MNNIDFEIKGEKELLKHLLKILPKKEAYNAVKQLMKQPSGTVVDFFGVDNINNHSVQKRYRIKFFHN